MVCSLQSFWPSHLSNVQPSEAPSSTKAIVYQHGQSVKNSNEATALHPASKPTKPINKRNKFISCSESPLGSVSQCHQLDDILKQRHIARKPARRQARVRGSNPKIVLLMWIEFIGVRGARERGTLEHQQHSKATPFLQEG